MTIRKARSDGDGLHRLEDIETEEVSLVDRAANKRKFILTKRGNVAPEIVENDDGSFSAQSALALSTESRESILEAVGKTLSRLQGIQEIVKSAQIDDTSASIPEELAKDIGDAIRVVSKSGIVKQDDDDDDDDDTTYSKDKGKKNKKKKKAKAQKKFPDSAFAVVKTAKGEDAATRFFRHHSSDVGDPNEHETLDVEALKRSLKALEKSDLPEDELAAARRHLERHADAVLESRGGDPSLVEGRSDDGNSDNREGTSKARGQWMQELKELFGTMKEVVSEAKKAPQDAPNTKGPNVGSGEQPDDSAVSDAARIMRDIPGLADLTKVADQLQESLDEMRDLKKKVSKQNKTIEKQREEIESLKNGVGLPSSQTPTGESVTKKDTGDVVWPHDMNAKQRDY